MYINCWHTPGGGIDEGETPEQAVEREVCEETGIDIGDESKQLIDDKGVGESIKRRPGEEAVLVKMTFAIYKVTLAAQAADVQLVPADDLVDLTWFDLDELDHVKQVPPAYALMKRIGAGWLIDK